MRLKQKSFPHFIHRISTIIKGVKPFTDEVIYNFIHKKFGLDFSLYCENKNIKNLHKSLDTPPFAAGV